MSNKLTYKGYSGSMEVSLEDDCLFGKIQDINDIITYEGNTVSELRAAFQVAVDEYLQFCLENNKVADKPYSGSFNVRIDKALHKQAAIAARDQDSSLNALIGEALQSYLNKSQNSLVQEVRPSPHVYQEYLLLEHLLTSESKPEIWEIVNERAH